MKVNSVFETLLFTTVRIEARLQDNSISVGTGFIFDYTIEDKVYLFLVTNKHVINKTIEGTLLFNLTDKKVPLLGKHYGVRVGDFEANWTGHKEADIDVAIMPFSPVYHQLAEQNVYVYFKAIKKSLIPSQEQLAQIDAIEDIIFIGYPSNIYDRANLLPIVRKGTTATPISVDFEGKPMFLIDASVFPGSSGSPVFLCNVGSYSPRGKGLVIGNRLFFLGIISSVYVSQDMNTIEIINIPTGNLPIVKTSQMIDLGLVYKASVIIEVIEDFLKSTNQL